MLEIIITLGLICALLSLIVFLVYEVVDGRKAIERLKDKYTRLNERVNRLEGYGKD